jgi:predicted nucleotidyltransferase
MDRHKQFIESFSEWAKQKTNILGAALVGSHARGTAHADSDIDLVIITSVPSMFLTTEEWINKFGSVRSLQNEDHRSVQTRRAYYQDGLEVEFGVTTPDWLQTEPIDEGTRAVMMDGHRVLDDKAGLFATFFAALPRNL